MQLFVNVFFPKYWAEKDGLEISVNTHGSGVVEWLQHIWEKQSWVGGI